MPVKSPVAKLSKWVKTQLSINKIEERVKDELDNQIYSWIIEAEAQYLKKGFEKYMMVVNKLFAWAIANGYGKYAPYLVGLVQPAVEKIYNLTPMKEETSKEVAKEATKETAAAGKS